MWLKSCEWQADWAMCESHDEVVIGGESSEVEYD